MTEYENRNKMESFIYVTKDKFNEILNNPELNQFVSS